MICDQIHPNNTSSHLSVKLKPEREQLESSSQKIRSEVDTMGEAYQVGAFKEVATDQSNTFVHLSNTSVSQSLEPKLASDAKFTPAAVSACVARMFNVIKSDTQGSAGSVKGKTKLSADTSQKQHVTETQKKDFETAIETGLSELREKLDSWTV